MSVQTIGTILTYNFLAIMVIVSIPPTFARIKRVLAEELDRDDEY